MPPPAGENALRHFLIILYICVLSLSSAAQQPPPAGRYNVLFLPVDDLKPLLGCYGATQVKTPNIDALAKRGLTFTRAYCQQAVCAPSRASLMTGRRPDATRVYDLVTPFRKALPDAVTLSQRFKDAGYFAASVGKIYHPGLDDAASWSVPNNYKLGGTFFDPNLVHENKAAGKANGAPDNEEAPVRGRSFEITDVPDDDLPDGKIARHAIDLLRANKDRPFFIAAGFMRPHLPFVAPRKYYDLYPPDSIQLADNPAPPKDGPRVAMHNSGELRSYGDISKKGKIDDAKARELIRGYYASTSFVDAQIGKVLAELDRLGLADRTIVVLWGDHGYHLGDHGLWTKHSNFEEAARAPLILAVPGMKHAGATTAALVEFVDVYPTLCDLAGLPAPAGLEGASFKRLLDDPKQPFKPAAFSQYPRGKETMGRSMRTDRYRYTEWQDKTGQPTARELYDHQADPQENTNLANRPEHRALVEKLHAQLQAGWQAALPPNR
jgi:arylsulfatase A-like enzyme